MSERKTNLQLAQEINARIGQSPVPFDSVYSVALDIYNELGGEPAEFDTVYSILLETLPLAESVAKKTSITEVDELPDAKDNNNIYRLSSDDKVYMSKNVSTEDTNRLPDEQLIDKAFLWETDEDIYYYKGAWKIICSDGKVDGYGWLEYISAEQWNLILTQDDAVKISNDTTNTTYFSFNSDDNAENVDFDAHTVTLDVPISYYQWDEADSLIGYGIVAVVPATYNAPEAAQIGNATLEDNQMSIIAVYSGEEVEYLDENTQEQCVGYKWTINEEGSGYDCIVTSKKASEIYFYSDGEYIYTDTIVRAVVDGVGEYSGFETLYIPQLNAPDSEQVGKAYIEDNGIKYYYRGECNVQCTDGSIVCYWWCSNGEYTQENAFFSEEPANSIYKNSILALSGPAAHNLITYINEHQFTSNGAKGNLMQDFDDDAETVSCETAKYQSTIKNWEWKQILTMDDIPQTIVIKIEDPTSATELSKLDSFTETGIYNNINLQVKYNNTYFPATLEVLKESEGDNEAINQEIIFNNIYNGDTYCINRLYSHESWEYAFKLLKGSIYISNTGDTQMAKLDNFTETGVYNNIRLNFLGNPATLIVDSNVINGVTHISQYIKYVIGDSVFKEYVWGRIKIGNNAWENNAGGKSPIELFDIV